MQTKKDRAPTASKISKANLLRRRIKARTKSAPASTTSSAPFCASAPVPRLHGNGRGNGHSQSNSGGRISDVQRAKQAHFDYLAHAAHEIRSPLSSLIGFSGLLLNFEFDDATRRDFLLSIQGQAERLNRLINDLVDLAKLETSGSAVLKLSEVDLSAAARAAVETFRSTHADAHVDVYLSDNLPSVKADAVLIARLLAHLIENAVQYASPDARARLSTLVSGEGNAKTVVLCIEDRGAGIAVQDQAHLGEKFYRGTSSVAGTGNGLGLALVKTIVDCHGGRMHIDSVPNRGTIVNLEFPAQAGHCSLEAA